MLHKEFFGFIFLAFVAWIFLASDGSARISRGCRPLVWTGNVVVSGTALVLPSQQHGVDRWVKKVDYGCQYMAWRLIYQDDYNKAMEAANQVEAAALSGDGLPPPGNPPQTVAIAPPQKEVAQP